MNQHQLDEVLEMLDQQIQHQEDLLLGPVSRLLDAVDSSLGHSESEMNRIRGRASRRAGARLNAQEEMLRGPLQRLENYINSGIDDRDTHLSLVGARVAARTSGPAQLGDVPFADVGGSFSSLSPPSDPTQTPAVNGGGGVPLSLLGELESTLPGFGGPGGPELIGPPTVVTPPAGPVCPATGPSTPLMPLSIGGIVCPTPPTSPLTPIPLPILLPQLLPVLPGPLGGLLGPILTTVVNNINNLFISPISITLTPPSVTVTLAQILSQLVNVVQGNQQNTLVNVVNNLPESTLNSLVQINLTVGGGPGGGVVGEGAGAGGLTPEVCPPEGCPQCGGDIGVKVKEGTPVYIVPWGVHQGEGSYYASECSTKQIEEAGSELLSLRRIRETINSRDYNYPPEGGWW